MNKRLSKKLPAKGKQPRAAVEKDSGQWRETTLDALRDLLKRKPVKDGTIAPMKPDGIQFTREKREIEAKLCDEELTERIVSSVNELLRRAENGSKKAVERLAIYTGALVNELNALAKKKPELVQQVSKGFDHWPVTLSLIDQAQSAESWDAFFKSTLRLGEVSFIPTNRRQKIDFTNIWHRHLLAVLKAARVNKGALPRLREQCKDLEPKYQCRLPVGREGECGCTYYEFETDTVLISDFGAACGKLPDRLSNEPKVIEKFMEAVKLGVIEYWTGYPEEHKAAFDSVKPYATFDTEGNLRARCFAQMRLALETLAGK